MASKNTIVLASALCAAFIAPIGGAVADGSYAAPSSCTDGRFAGIYIGANIGYADNDASQITRGFKIEGDDSSVAGGGQVGYNRQCGRFLYGIEADISALDLEAEAAYPGPVYATSSIDWLGTVRGRLGFVHADKYLIYATGGLAYAKLDHHLFDPSVPFSQTDSSWKAGWTVGGGIEWLCGTDSRWSLRAEALYADLGSQSHHYQFSTGCATCTADTDWDDDLWVARIGFNYRFGPEPAPAPLK